MSIATDTGPGIMGAIETWAAGSLQRTIERPEMTEGVVSVQSIDPQAIAELASVFGVHKATVRSAHGGRLTRVVGVQIYFEAPTD
ncbi:MAG: hypothetical protein ABSC41_20170, partial [Acidimicrobiales bacterium]